MKHNNFTVKAIKTVVKQNVFTVMTIYTVAKQNIFTVKVIYSVKHNIFTVKAINTVAKHKFVTIKCNSETFPLEDFICHVANINREEYIKIISQVHNNVALNP